MPLTNSDLLQKIQRINIATVTECKYGHNVAQSPSRPPHTPDKDFKALSRLFTHYFGLWPKYPDPSLILIAYLLAHTRVKS